MKEIGGFFELQLPSGLGFHNDAVAVNSGRNAFRCFLRSVRPEKVFLPFYICDSILEPLEAEGIKYQFYPLDDTMAPVPEWEQSPHDWVLVVNYFGLHNALVRKLTACWRNVVVDNVQAFFCPPEPEIPTFYSPRKFFGVPDGGYIYGIDLNDDLEVDFSCTRASHLLKRLDGMTTEGYADFRENEKSISDLPPRLMSPLTEALLKSVDYSAVARRRSDNFHYLHQRLYSINDLSLPTGKQFGPLAYPFMSSQKGLRDYLLAHKIYIPAYWKEAADRTGKDSAEARWFANLLPLPIDQRYDFEDMERIVQIITAFMNIKGVSGE